MVQQTVDRFLRSLAGRRRVLLFGEMNLFPQNYDLLRRSNAEFDARTGGPENFDLHVVADQQAFPCPAPDYQHATSNMQPRNSPGHAGANKMHRHARPGPRGAFSIPPPPAPTNWR